MIRDERTRHLRRLRRLRNSARRWTVLAGGLAGTAVVLVPYGGLGALDALWAGLAGASAVMAGWRWADHRQLAAQPVPEPPDRGLPGDPWLALVSHVPGGEVLAERVRQARTRAALRGSKAADAWNRLDRASRSLRTLAVRFTGPERETLAEAAKVEERLRDLTGRITGLEEALRLAPHEARPPLEELRDDHVAHLEAGVAEYERYVAAAAAYLAEAGRQGAPAPQLEGLTDATERLRAISTGLAELRRQSEAAPGTGTVPGTGTQVPPVTGDGVLRSPDGRARA